MNLKTLLNDKQYEAVTSSFKYNRIIAGAGSGKTRVLTYRLAYLINDKNIDPYNLLAITFTNKVAKEMLNRTEELLGNIDISSLKISTFHSFCSYFLRNEIYHINFPRSFVIIDDNESENMIYYSLTSLGHDIKKGDTLVKSTIRFIAKNKTKGLLPSDIKEEDLVSEEMKIMYEAFKEYEKNKVRSYALDFDDLLIYTRNILREFSDVKEKYNTRFKEILVDEFQDTNDLQFELLTLLVGKDTGLYVVGDPDQTIYTWRGANLRVILDVEKYFRDLQTFILDENYRSTKNILTAANKLIIHNAERVKKDLFTKNESGEEVSFFTAQSDFEEARKVVQKIRELTVKNDAKYSEIAILYRSAYLSRPFEQILMKERIPYRVYSGTKFYDRREVKDVLAYLSLLTNPKNDVAFERVYNVPKRGIGDVSYAKFKQEAYELNLNLYQYALDLYKYDSEVSKKSQNALSTFILKLEKANDLLIGEHTSQEFSGIMLDFLNDIKYFDYLQENEEDGDDRALNVRSLISDIANTVTGKNAISIEEYLQNVTLLTSQDDIVNDGDSITLMTCHTAKGLEFNYVFVVGLNKDVFPNYRALQEGKEREEEERRLAYVAFTRARKILYLSCNLGHSFISGTTNEVSQFVIEAGLSLKPKNSFIKIGKDNLYSFDFNKFMEEKKKIEEEERKERVIGTSFKNNIKWSVGDLINHKTFGKGKVINIEGEILTIDFESQGIKRLLGSHPSLSKVEK